MVTLGQQGFGCEASLCFSHCHQAVSAVFLLQRRERGTCDPGNGADRDLVFGEDADHAVEGPYKFLSVPRDEASVDVLWAETRRYALHPGPVFRAWGLVAVVHFLCHR